MARSVAWGLVEMRSRGMAVGRNGGGVDGRTLGCYGELGDKCGMRGAEGNWWGEDEGEEHF